MARINTRRGMHRRETGTVLPQYLERNGHKTPAVIIGLDDGYASQYDTAYHLARGQQLPFGIYFYNAPSVFTMDQVTEMYRAGYEILSHTGTHVQLDTLTLGEQEAQIQAGTDELLALGFTRGAYYVAYPSGSHNADTFLAMAATGQRLGRTIDSTFTITGRLTEPYHLPASQLNLETTLADTEASVDSAVLNGEVLILYGHHIATPIINPGWTIEDFIALLAYLKANAVQVITMDDLHNLQSGPVTIPRRSSTPPGICWAEVGDIDFNTVVVAFNEYIATDATFSTGVTITINAAAATITSATRQSDGFTVRYVLAETVANGAAVVFSYDSAVGTIENLSGVRLKSEAKTVINNVPALSVETLQPDAAAGVDTFIAGDTSANTNYGTNAAIQIRNNAKWQNGLIKFDLSGIPAGSTIFSATLSLWTSTQRADTGTITAYRILAANSAWTEAGATWNYAVATATRWAGDAGGDGGADAGCSVSGTDYSATALGSTDFADGEVVNTQHDIALNVSEMQSMFAANCGMVLIPTAGTRYMEARSSDYATDATKRPKLVVYYY
ncbi:MAG: DNRLRE domain-containing protein [Parcubacteria group bacterium]